MQKKIPVIILMLAITFISSSLYSQSTIIIDNLDSKPVPVKLINPTTIPVKIPFTQFSTITPGSNAITLLVEGPKTVDSVKVIEYVLGTCIQSTQLEITVNLANTPGTPSPLVRKYMFNIPFGVNTYSGSMIIVLRKGDSVNVLINGSTGKDMLVSGYIMKQ